MQDGLVKASLREEDWVRGGLDPRKDNGMCKGPLVANWAAEGGSGVGRAGHPPFILLGARAQSHRHLPSLACWFLLRAFLQGIVHLYPCLRLHFRGAHPKVPSLCQVPHSHAPRRDCPALLPWPVRALSDSSAPCLWLATWLARA